MLSSREHGPTKQPPKTPNDPYNLVFLICLILGCGTLLAYNVLVSCATYFNYQYSDYPNIMFLIVPIFSIPNLFFIILMIPFGDRFSWTSKITSSFIILGILVLLIPFIASTSTSNYNVFNLLQYQSYHIFLCIVVFIGAITAILQCSIFAFCGLLPIKYLQTVSGGQAVSGILVCVIRIFSKLFLPLTPKGIEQSGMIYFMISASISIICAISFYWTKHSAFVQHHVQDHVELQYDKKFKRVMLGGSPSKPRSEEPLFGVDPDATPVRRQLKGKMERKKVFTYDTTTNISPRGTERIQLMDAKTVNLPVLIRADTPHALAAFVQPHPQPAYHDIYADVPHDHSPFGQLSISYISDDDILTPIQTPYHSNYGAVDKGKDAVGGLPKYSVKHHRFNYRKYVMTFRDIRYLVLSVWLSMFVTFLWFPGIIANIQSSFEIINQDGNWMAIIMITEFNIFDFIGRQFMSSWTPQWLKDDNLWTCSLLRIIVYPVFIMFYKGYIINDYLLHLLMIVSAISNGWITSLSFMWFPKNIKKHQQNIAASIMTLGCIMGILCGSSLALIIQPYITQTQLV